MNRHFKRLLALMLALVMVLSMAVPAFAADTDHSGTVGVDPAYLYVKAGEGRDTNPGTDETAPLLTLGKALELANSGTEIVILSDIPVSQELRISGKHVTISSKNGQYAITYTGTASTIGTSSGIIKVVDGTAAHFHDITLRGSEGAIDGRVLYIENASVCLTNATVKNGRVNTVSTHGGGAGVYVGNKGKLALADKAKILNNTTKGVGGGIYVDNGGSLTVSGNDISISGNTAVKGGGIYLATQETTVGTSTIHGTGANGLTFSDNTATENGGAMYVEKTANASVSGKVTASGHKVKDAANNIFLAKDATLDIFGYTKDSNLCITAEDEYAYRLISNPVKKYAIKTSPLAEADEAYWTDDCGEWDIRYLDYNGVPGLYLVYHTIGVEIEDVRTLTKVEAADLIGDIVDFMTTEFPDATLVNGLLTVPAVIMQSNSQSKIDGDLSFIVSCDEDHRIPTEDIVKVTCKGVAVPFRYTPDFEAGVASLVIARDDVDALSGGPLHIVVTADEYHDLTIRANGPLYALSTSITGRTMTPVTVSSKKTGSEAIYTITRADKGLADVTVELYKEGGTAVAATAVTDADGNAKFTGLDTDATYFPILNYQDTYKVIDRETITVEPLSTLEGQTLADEANISVGDMDYKPMDGKAVITNVNADSTATFSVKQNVSTITFWGNEGEATTAPATIALDGSSKTGSLVKQMESAALTVGKLPTAAMVGYTFGGWYETADCDGAPITSDAAYTPGAYQNLYAKWTPNTNTAYKVEHWVEFAENGVNEGKTGEVKDGFYLYETTAYADGTSDAVKDISALDLKKMSSETVKWWTRQGFSARVQSAPCKVLADGTAVFQIFYDRNVYDVTFEVPLSAGTAVSRPDIPGQTAKFGDVFGNLPDPKLPGYNYSQDKGVWYDGDRLVTATSIFVKTEPVKLVARWNPNDNTKWAIKMAVRDLKTLPSGEIVTGDVYQEYKTVYKDNDGNFLTGISDTTISVAVKDNAALDITGFHVVGYTADTFSSTGEGMTKDKESFAVTIKPTDASTEANGVYNEAFDGSIVWLYYDRNTVPVTFVDGQGEETKTEIIFGGDFTGHLPPDPGKDGYDFTGWVDPDGNPVEDDTKADEYVKKGEELIVTPTWKAREYQLTYVPGKGASYVPDPSTKGKVEKSSVVAGGYIDPTIYTYDEPFGTLPTAAKPGYNFVEWATETGVAINKDMPVTVDNVVISNAPVYNYEDTRPLFAKFQPHTYTLIFDPGTTKAGIQGIVDPETLKVTFDAEVSGVPTPALTGYRFVEWRLDPDDPSTKVEDGQIWNRVYTDEAEILVYAIWVPISYRYDFDVNDAIGSTRASLVDTTIEYTEETYDSVYNGVVSVEATRPGYNFLGWSMTKDGEVLTAETMNRTPEDTTVYAIWSPKEYTVKMLKNGGETVDLSDNSDLSTYDPTAVYDVENDTWTVTVKFDTTFGELPVASKYDCVYRGYKVNAPGWPATDAFGPSIHGQVILALPQYIDYLDEPGIVLSAVLEPYFTFDPDGSSFVPDGGKEPVKILQSDISKLPVVEKPNYTYVGWVDESGKLVDLDDIKTKTEPETLKPKFVANLSLDANGGKVNDKEVDVLPMVKDLDKLPDAVRAGYIFLGWYTAAEGGEKVDLAKLKTANTPVTIYAHWQVRSYGGGGGGGGGVSAYTVTFETNGGSSVPSQSVSYGQKVKKPTDPTRKFYSFNGWYTDKELKEPFDFEKTSVRKSMTLYAAWTYTGVGYYLTDEHIVYIIGRGDGLVHPEANITRAEVAAIFYRLLKPEVRQLYRTTENTFTDVAADAWYAAPVSTLAKMGMIKGRGEGIFDPDANITRAELAVIAARFDTMVEGSKTFPDVSSDYWAHKEIGSAAAKGWVEGRDDGTFAPDLPITRSEVMTLINRVTGRATITLESIITDTPMVTWDDNADTTAWYYLAVQEATNAHTHDMVKGVETWRSLKPVDVAK